MSDKRAALLTSLPIIETQAAISRLIFRPRYLDTDGQIFLESDLSPGVRPAINVGIRFACMRLGQIKA